MVKVFQKIYGKEEFIKFLKFNNVNNITIDRFIELPKIINSKNNKNFELYINTIRYSIGFASYNFELNYYSDELVEFLFNTKVVDNVEVSINNLKCEIINLK